MNCNVYTALQGEVAAFAAKELWRYLTQIDSTLVEGEGGINLVLRLTDKPSRDVDHIDIKVENGRGYISGANEGALLIAVYRFLFELGCRFTFPGKGGEHIPEKVLTPDALCVSVCETPSRRHRGVCIEGGVSEENVREMIDFLPKVGMNSYFFQFFSPSIFFRRWYEHHRNPLVAPEEFDQARMDAIHERLIGEVTKRGLRHHAVGHGWTCEPFGVHATGWDQFDLSTLPADFIEASALVNGARGAYRGVPLNTNLCYSNPTVRNKMSDAITEYCRTHKNVDIVHLWLADGTNNNCECENCRKALPSDFYVMLLNELDEKLTAAGLDTKIVFLMYVDLLWAPEHEVIKNPDRFIAMFAPIKRTYSHTLREGAAGADNMVLPPYVRNKLHFSDDVADNVAHRNEWRRAFNGSAFLFDYHLMWDHSKDPGYMQCAKTLFEDMKDLDVVGMDGMISCQLSRCSFPTGLPLYGMAKALWNKDADFDATADEYFTAEFGKAAGDVRAYLTELSRRFDPVYIRAEKPRVDPEATALYDTIPTLIAEFRAAHPEMSVQSESEAWRILAYHADACLMMAAILAARARGENRVDLAEALRTYVWHIEPEVQCRLDAYLFNRRFVSRSLLDTQVKTVTQ